MKSGTPLVPAQDDRCLHELFEAQVARAPLAIALRCDGEQLHYGELNARANRLAHHLRALGVGAEVRVAICLDRSFDLVIAVLAVLKAGGAYVPIDPSAPAQRIALTLDDAAPPILVTHEATLAALPQTSARAVCMDRDAADIARRSALDPARCAGANSLAYVIYTSGSTGRPKGVELEHRQVVRLFATTRDWVQFRADDVWALFHSIAFDASVWELFGALAHGATLVIVPHWLSRSPADYHQLLRDERISVTLQTPLALRGLIEAQGGMSTEQRRLPLRLLFCGGEAMNPAWLLPWFEQEGEDCPEVYNLYGITEAAVISTYRRITSADIGVASNGWIGHPLADTRIHLLDADLCAVQDGDVGEIHIAGPALARGYLHQPELTAERFVVARDSGERLYRSGDLARRLPNGELEFLGRADHQVKIRGFRIELGEIEAALCSTGLVSAAHVITRSASDGDTQLIGYVVAAVNTQPQALALRAALSCSLPDYMIPAAFVVVDAFPLNENGKLNRRALPEPAAECFATPQSTAPALPQSATEAALLPIWRETLNNVQLGVNDDFFLAGGNSLSAVRLVAQVQQLLGKKVSLKSFLQAPTLAGMAAAMDQLGRCEAEGVPLLPDSAQRYTAFPLTDIQRAYWLGRGGGFVLSNIATHAYAELTLQDLDVERFEQAWNHLIERHDMLRMVVTPHGEQRVLRDVPHYHVVRYDLRQASAGDRAATLQSVRDALSHQVFSGHEWPLFDLRVSRVDEQQWLVHVSLDALALDLASIHILSRELSALYDTPERALPPLQLAFRDYVLAERARESLDVYRQSRDYWLSRLDSLPAAPDLPFACDPATIVVPRFERRSYRLCAARWSRLKALAAQRRISTNILVAGSYAEVLRRWARNDRFALNFTLFNRLPLHAQVGDLVGDFTSLTLLEVERAQAGSRFVDRLEALQHQMWSDLEHRHFGGMQVQQELARLRGRAQPYAVVVTSALGLDEAATAPRFDIYPAVVQTQTPQVWIDFLLSECNGELVCHWDSVVDLFPQGMLEAMLGAFGELLEKLADDVSAIESTRFELLPPAQRALIEATNATHADLLAELQATPRLHGPLLQQITRQGEKIAVISGARVLSYRKLGVASQRLAAMLIAGGAQPNRLIAIVMEKGWEQVVASLAILRAGAAYLPIDASLPAERIAQLLALGEVEQVVTVAAAVSRLPLGLCVVRVDDTLFADAPLQGEAPRQAYTDLAYVIFTSGSTGIPKGVMIDHRGALNTVLDINARYAVTSGDSVLGLSSLSFDLSVYDVFGVLGAGGTLVLPQPDELRDPQAWLHYLGRHRITLWNTVPALLQMLVDYAPTQALPLTTILLSGDWIPTDLPQKVWAQAPQAKLYSLGGATEASIWSIDYPIAAMDPRWRSVPYGMALANQQFFVLKPDLELAPLWSVGELYIGGIGLALGYWKDADKTRHSFTERQGQRLYRTGDLGRLLPDGNIEFLGRDDAQVKIQGYRIELGEIEARLKGHAQVRDAVVSTYSVGRTKQLVAYVVTHESTDSAGSDAAAERIAFVLERRGLRKDLNGHETLALPQPASLALELRREPPLPPLYPPKPLAFDTLCGIFAPLRAIALAERALPKFFYPSAGGLYPVQCYVSLGDHAVRGGMTGSFYYDRERHSLIRCGEALGSGVVLVLVADMDAIEPMYAAHATSFARIEAGHMQQLLLSALPDGVGVKVLSAVSNADALRAALCLGVRHRPMVALELGVAAEDPSERVALSPIARQSYRRFLGRRISRSVLLGLLDAVAASASSQLSLIIWAANDRMDDLAGGCYRYAGNESDLLPLADANATAAFAGTAAPLREAHFCVFVVGEETGATDVAAGALGQALMQVALPHDIGFCAVGGVDSNAAQREFRLAHGKRLLYALVGGGITSAQANQLPPAGESVSIEQKLTRHLAEALPEYMLPRAFVMLRELPLSANGKVDRGALPAPVAPGDTASEPRTPTERCLSDLVADLLGLDAVDVASNFFEVGGNSLLAVQLLARIRDAFDVSLVVRTIFTSANLRELARHIDAAGPDTVLVDAPIPQRNEMADLSGEELLEL